MHDLLLDLHDFAASGASLSETASGADLGGSCTHANENSEG